MTGGQAEHAGSGNVCDDFDRWVEKLHRIRHPEFLYQSLGAGQIRPIVIDPEPMRHRPDDVSMSLDEDVICLLPCDPTCGDDNRNSRVIEVHGSLSRGLNRFDVNSVANYSDPLGRQTVAD